MRLLFYTHSLVSDWNHGNAHFLRGVMRDLGRRGHDALALEPAGSWSRRNLVVDQGEDAVAAFHRTFPTLRSQSYHEDFDHEAVLSQADVVVVHEWTDPALVARIGAARARGGRFLLLFHDTHHRAVSAAGEIGGMDLGGYDGVLAFGESLRDRYLRAGWGRQAWTWHEAADDALFRPLPGEPEDGDLVWIGNWGDNERGAELREFLVEPIRALGLRAAVRGVRYPPEALAALGEAGIAYGGWLPNADAPRAFARHRVTVHVPRRPYVEALPGIPTIRPFEALACGIPLVSAPWDDAERLFRPGDFLWARDGAEMRRHLRALVADPAMRAEQAARGLETIRARHTCRHRVDELLAILHRLGAPASDPAPEPEAVS
jgi:spore maturation protein CgeB